MADNRSLREKLALMAERGTPEEAAIARTKLGAIGQEPPRDPPTRVAAPAPGPSFPWRMRATIQFTVNGTYAWTTTTTTWDL